MRFKQVDEDLGKKLLAPIRGNCQKELIGDWIYNFCIGKSVDHVHFENSKEQYIVGNATKFQNQTELMSMNLKENQELQTLTKFLGNSTLT